MSIADPIEPPAAADPDAFRMTIGEHLEELRRRLIYAIAGLGVIATICFWYGNQVLVLFCRPIYSAQTAEHLNTQLHTTELDEGFFVWVKVNLIVAAVLSGPWMIYQLWQFVAAGLYPRERKYITRYMPLSVGLMVAGVSLVYFAVLPWTCLFFLKFTASVPTPNVSPIVQTDPNYKPVYLPHVMGDPAKPREGEVWIDDSQGKVKFFFDGNTRSLTFNTDTLLAPHISLSDYIDMVVGLIITFALAFQMPLVVLAVVKIGIVEISTLTSIRRYVYFSMSILSAVLAPHDVVTAQVALMVPLILLYEMGIFLAKRSERADRLAAGG